MSEPSKPESAPESSMATPQPGLPVLPYSPVELMAGRSIRRPVTAVPFAFFIGAAISGAISQVIIFVLPIGDSDPLVCCSVGLAPVISALIGAAAMLPWQVLLSFLRGGGFSRRSNEAYMLAGAVHGVLAAIGWLALGLLEDTQPNAPVGIKVVYAFPIFAVPLIGPLKLLWRPLRQLN